VPIILHDELPSLRESDIWRWSSLL